MKRTDIKLTKRAYEEYLNSLSSSLDNDSYWMGGKLRLNNKITGRYGTALRKYDPIAFNTGYCEWVKENEK